MKVGKLKQQKYGYLHCVYSPCYGIDLMMRIMIDIDELKH